MTRNEIGAIILRLFLGLAFFIHGLAKFQGGIENTVGYFDMLGLPGFSAYAVAIIELVGGLALILGLGTRIVSTLLAIIMVVAVVLAKLPLGFMGDGQMGGYELELAFLVIAIYLALANRTRFSLDNMFFSNDKN